MQRKLDKELRYVGAAYQVYVKGVTYNKATVCPVF